MPEAAGAPSAHDEVARPSMPPPSDDELARAPLLAYLAAAAAIVDLVVNRWWIRSLDQESSRDLQFDLQLWGSLPRNLAAIAGVVALAAALITFVRLPGYAPIRRRLSLAAFAGIFLPTVTLATMLPREYTSVQLVVFGIGAGNVLAILAALTSLRRPGPVGLRVALAIASVSSLTAMLALLFGLMEGYSEIVALGVLLLRRACEALWLAIPFVVAVSILPRIEEMRARERLALGGGAVAAMFAAAALTSAAIALREDFAIVLYGAFRVEWALDVWPLVYLVPIGVYAGVAATALLARSPATRQVGAALLLLLCAGQAPRAPGRLLAMVLGVTILARAAIAMRDRVGAPLKRPGGGPPAPAPPPPAPP